MELLWTKMMIMNISSLWSIWVVYHHWIFVNKSSVWSIWVVYHHGICVNILVWTCWLWAYWMWKCWLWTCCENVDCEFVVNMCIITIGTVYYQHKYVLWSLFCIMNTDVYSVPNYVLHTFTICSLCREVRKLNSMY